MAYLERWRTGRRRVDLVAADGECVELDGASLASMGCWPTSIALGAATATLSVVDVPGRHGTVDLSLEDATGAAYMSNRTLTLGIATDASWDETLHAVKSDIGALNGRSVTVWAEPLDGAMTGRCSVGEWADGRGVSTCELTFDVGPMVSGDAVAVQLSSGENVVAVTGNRPALAAFTLNATSGATHIIVADGEGHALEYNPGAAIGTTATITIDCDAQEVALGSSAVAPTIESDYPVLLPGENVIMLTNCNGSLVYTPQILI